jgi:hypothetical protein
MSFKEWLALVAVLTAAFLSSYAWVIWRTFS